MAARWHVIAPPARAALESASACNGPRLTITRQLSPAVWPQVKLVMEALGAVYVVGTSAFEFEADRSAESVVRDALSAGRVMHDKGLAGFVPTPTALAEHLVRWHAEFPSGPVIARVLEPSAGTGRLVNAIVEFVGREWVHVTAVEAEPRRARQIQTGEHMSVHNVRFEEYALRATAAGECFDAIVMNPPFAVPGKPTLWVDHVLLAWKLLAPGGRLVAIVPASVLNSRPRNKRAGWLRELVRVNGEAVQLEEDEFAESRVSVATAVVWLDRPPVQTLLPAPPASRHPALFRRYSGEEPAVPVDRPYLTRAAARSMPVQRWYDSWRGRARTFRYRAECAGCERPLWTFDDGQNDPRGVLGNNSGCYSIDALDDHETCAAPVGLCPSCGETAETVTRVEPLARRLWAEEAAAPIPKAPTPPPKPAPTAADTLMLFDPEVLDAPSSAPAVVAQAAT